MKVLYHSFFSNFMVCFRIIDFNMLYTFFGIISVEFWKIYGIIKVPHIFCEKVIFI
jgi:hypothetical protein